MKTALALLTFATPAEACRLALLLALDVSGSVDATEYQLQRQGLAAALTAPAVQTALFGAPGQPVHLAVFEWAGPTDQKRLLDWTPLSNPAALAAATRAITAPSPRPASDNTALGAAIAYAGQMFARAPRCAAYTLDISGDGKNNHAPAPAAMRDSRALAGVTINGLIIGVDDAHGGDHRQLQIGELSSYFHANVIKGPGSFVESALGYADYERAMTRKLLREINTLLIGALFDTDRQTR